MCFTVIAAAIGGAAATKSAVDGRKAAKEQARQMAADSAAAAAAASEAARGSTLAQQSAIERDRAAALAKINAEAAAVTTVAPDVEVAAAGTPAEAARRRTVRATFAADDGVGNPGAIRV